MYIDNFSHESVGERILKISPHSFISFINLKNICRSYYQTLLLGTQRMIISIVLLLLLLLLLPLMQRDRAMLRVIAYLKSLKITQGHQKWYYSKA